MKKILTLLLLCVACTTMQAQIGPGSTGSAAAPFGPETFAAIGIPAGWGTYFTTGNTWVTAVNQTNNSTCANSGDGTPGGGTRWALLDQSGTDAGNCLQLPDLDVSSLTAPLLQFNYFMCGIAIPNETYVEYWDGTAWVIAQSNLTATNGWETRCIDITAFTFDVAGDSVRLRFRAESGGAGDDFNADNSIDDVQVIDNPPCTTPAMLTLTPATMVSCGTPLDTIRGLGINAPGCALLGYSFAWESSTDAGVTWNPAVGGTIIDDTTFVPAPLASGTIDYRLVVTCNASTTSTNSSVTSITASVAPVASITAAPDSISCGGSSTLDASTSTGATSYSWSPGGTLNMTTGAIVIASPGVSTTTYTVVASTAAGCTDTATVTVNVTGAKTHILETFDATFTGSPADWTDNGVGPNWSWDNNTTGSGNTGPSAGVGSPGYAYLETSSGAGSDTLFTPIFDLADASAGELSFYWHMYGGAMGTLEVYLMETDTLRNRTFTSLFSQTGQVQTDELDPWNKTTVSLPAGSPSYGTAQIVFVGIRGTSFTSDMAIDSVLVKSCSDACATPEGGTVHAFGEPNAVCGPTGLDLGLVDASLCDGYWTEATGTPTNSQSTYQWQSAPSATGPWTNVGTGDIFYNTGILASTTYFRVEVLCDPLSTPAYSSIFSVLVGTPPTMALATTPSSTIICSGDTAGVTLDASGTTGADSLSWTPSTSLDTDTGTVVVATPLATTSYTVTAYDSVGCSSDTTITVTVNPLPILDSLTASSDIICSGDTTMLAANYIMPTSATFDSYLFGSSATSTPHVFTSPTTIVSSGVDDNISAVQNIGFNFNYDGVNYTQFKASPDGFLTLGSTGVNDFSNSIEFPNAGNSPMLFPYWDDLATGTDGSVQMETVGTAPNRMLIVEWFVTAPRATTGPANARFQCKITETTNAIEYIYITGGTSPSASVGAGGLGPNPVANYQSVTLSSNTSSTTAVDNLNTALPANGTSYTLTPPPSSISYAWTPTADVVSPTMANTATNALTMTTDFIVSATHDSTGCVSTDTITVTVITPTAVATASPSASVCVGDTVTLMSGANATDTVMWNMVTTAGADTLLAPAIAGSYTLKITDSNGCMANDTIDIIVNTPLPFDSIVANTAPFCEGDTVTIQAFPGVASAYCISGFSSTADTHIDSTNINGTATTAVPLTNGAGYTDYTSTVVPVTAGTAFPISLTKGLTGTATYSAWATVYIDLDQNGVFDLPGEEFTSQTAGGFGSGRFTVTDNITIPPTATNGPTRMRIVLWESGSATTNQPCGGGTWGETEDYTIDISGGVPATPSFASITWDPTANLNPTTGDSLSAIGLTGTTTYVATGTDANGCVSMDSITITVNPLPTLMASATPAAICEGDSATLSATSSATDIVWNPGMLMGGTQTVAPTVSTVYTVVATDTMTGCTIDTAINLIVNPLPVIAVMVDTNESCPGAMDGIASATIIPDTVSIYTEGFVTATGIATTIPNAAAPGWTSSGSGPFWRTDNNGGNSGGTGPVAGANTPGYVFLESSSGAGEDTLISPAINMTSLTGGAFVTFYYHMYGSSIDSLAFLVDNGTTVTQEWALAGQQQTASTDPWIPVTIDLSAYIGQNINLMFRGKRTIGFANDMAIDDIEVINTLPATLLWSNAATTDTITGLTAGTYTVTATSAAGCIASDSVMITTLGAEPVLAAVGDTVCTGDPATVMSGGTSANTIYTWNSNPGNVDTTITPAVAGQYIVVATDTVSGCIASDTADVVVNTLTLSASASPDSICIGGSATLSATGDATDYVWTPGMLMGATHSITPTATTTYTVTATDSVTGCTADSMITVIVNPNCFPLNVDYKTFKVTKLTTSDLVEWTTVAEQNNKWFNILRSNDGQVFETLGTVNSKAIGGNSNSELNYSFVDQYPQVGHNYYKLEQVDFDNSKRYTNVIDIIWGRDGSVVSIYPNPAKDILNIDISAAKVAQTEIKLLDMSGRVVKSIIAQSVKGMNHMTLDLSDMADGVYGVQVFENNKLTHVSKVRKN